MTVNHRSCQGVDHIPDIARDILNNVEYTGMQKKITSLAQITTTAIQTSRDQAKLSQTYHASALMALKQLQKDISKAIDKIEKAIIKEADKVKVNDEKKMKSLEDKYKGVLKEIQTISSKFTSLQNNGKFCQMFIAMKRVWSEIDAIEARIRDPQHDTETRNYRLVKSREMQMLLDAPETMVKLETVRDSQSGSVPAQAATAPSTRHTQQVHKKTSQSAVLSPPALSQQGAIDVAPQRPAPTTLAAVQHTRDARKITRAQHVMNVNVNSSDDSDKPSITGCAVLPGDKLVMVDFKNNKLKLIDMRQNKPVSQLKLSGGVWDTTMLNNRQVAVTCSNTQIIYFVNVGDKLKLDREVKVKGQCRGIDNINDNLIVSYQYPRKVEIINMKGQVLQTVVTEDKGRQLFTRPWHVAVSKDQQTIYISDNDRGTITRVTLTGQVLTTYENGKLRGPHGLTVDTTGTVYVCGGRSHNILQLTADLTEVQVLLQLSDGVVVPYSVCYCEDTDRLYIGMLNSDVMKVYELK